MTRAPILVLRLDASDTEDVVHVLCTAFHDYPVMRFVLGAPPDYAEQLHRLVTFFVMARVHRDEVLLGVRAADAENEDRLAGAAIVSYPGRTPAPPALDALREETWAVLGAAARARYEAFGAAASRFDLEAPRAHLNMIGVLPEAQGKGVGRALLDAVHALAEHDESAVGVTLSTEDEANVGLYRHAGYEVLGSAQVGPGLTTWAFFRASTGR